jgi:hypothetical protein
VSNALSKLAIISFNPKRFRQALKLKFKESSDIYSKESINKGETIYSGINKGRGINQVSIKR